nr:conjugation protein [Enterobacter sp.]
MLFPVYGCSAYQKGTPLLQCRLFGKDFSTAADLAFEVENRLGGFLIPRTLGKEITWDFFSAVLDGDSNVIREYDTNDIDYGIYDAGEKVTFLNGTVDIYNPKRIHELRSKCVDIKNGYFMQVLFISMLAPEFVSIFFGLKPTSKTNIGSDSLSNDLSKAISNQLSQDSPLTDQFSKAASQVSSDQISNTNGFKEASSKMNQATQPMSQNNSTSVSTNASSNSGRSLDSKQSINLDRFSDSIRNKNFSDDDVRNFARKNGLDENAFMEKFNSYNDTFRASNQLGSQLQRTDALVAATRDFSEQKIAADTARGETAESNKQDLRETSSLLKSLVSDFGGNVQQLLPITNQLDRISGEGCISTISQAQDRTPEGVNTSGVMSASRVGELGGSVDTQAKLGLLSNAQDATQRFPGKSRRSSCW